MVLTGLILVNILILNIWLWITRTVWKQPKDQSSWWIPVLIGAISAGGLLLYPHLLNWSNMEHIDFTTNVISSWEIAGYLGVYLLLLLTVQAISSLQLLPSRIFLKQLVIFLIISGGLFALTQSFQVNDLLVYYLLVASSEELLKYFGGHKFQSRYGLASQDLLLSCLLVAVGFAFFENMTYLVDTVSEQLSWRSQLAAGSGVLLSRGIMGFLVHLLFTGLIAAGALYASQKNNLTRLIGGILLGITLHLTYNFLLSQHISLIIVIYLIGGYGFLSWIFYKSDRLYISS